MRAQGMILVSTLLFLLLAASMVSHTSLAALQMQKMVNALNQRIRVEMDSFVDVQKQMSEQIEFTLLEKKELAGDYLSEASLVNFQLLPDCNEIKGASWSLLQEFENEEVIRFHYYHLLTGKSTEQDKDVFIVLMRSCYSSEILPYWIQKMAVFSFAKDGDIRLLSQQRDIAMKAQ